MGQKSTVGESEKLEAVLMLLRKQESALVLARRYGVSEPTLYRWRDDFLEGGKSALAGGGVPTGRASGSRSWRSSWASGIE